MSISLDSCKILKSSYDSLQRVAGANCLFPIRFGEPAVQASLIIAVTTIITVALGFLFKDYWIPGWIELRSKRRAGQELFKRYKSNIFKSAESFAHRLAEIYRTRSHYLWDGAPKSSFYDYKYKSSVYRLCVLLAWIRAYRLEESSISIEKSDTKIHGISNALNALASSLADGQNVEMYVAKAICRINGIDTKELPKARLEKFSVEVDHLVDEYKAKHAVDYISELLPAIQDLFINDMGVLMKDLNVDIMALQGRKHEIVEEVSVKLGLIYRDWQYAIGDLMLEKNETKNSAVYSVVGYKRFEEMWTMCDKSEQKKWLLRAERMFKNLDLRVDENFDSRIQQLKRVYASVYNLLEKLYKINIGGKPLPKKDFKKISPSI